MSSQDTKEKIIKETVPSEGVSIIGSILAGLILSLLILPFHSFLALILIVPALLSLRGNISGPFIARTSRDLVIGDFNTKNWIQNVLATFTLSILTALLIGICSILLNITLFRLSILPLTYYLFIPLITILITLSISIPISTGLNYIAFLRGLDPNNVVNPVMTAIDDFTTVLAFYLTLLLLGVP